MIRVDTVDTPFMLPILPILRPNCVTTRSINQVALVEFGVSLKGDSAEAYFP
jgi:hypothetical protein